MLESFGLALCFFPHRMPIPRPLLTWLFLSLAGLMAAEASAAGIETGSSAVVMGQPLSFAAQVRLEPGATLEPQCVNAEVTAGDRRLATSLVSTVVEMIGVDLARVRVLTQQVVEEPVLGIDLSVGCQARMFRRFVLLADPPRPNPMVAPLALGASSNTAGALGGPASSPVMPLNGAAEAGDVRRPDLADVSAGRTQARAQVTPAKAAARRSVKAAAARSDGKVQRNRTARLKPRAEPARLRLDMLDSADDPQARAVEEALQAVAQAASAARAAASAASASAARIAALEQTVTQLRSDNQARSELVMQLRERLAQVDGSTIWLLPLLLLSGALAALAAWLAWRMATLQRAQQQAWRATPSPRAEGAAGEAAPSRQPTSPVPFVTANKPAGSGLAGEKPRAVPAWPPAAPAAPRPQWAATAGPSTLPESRDHTRTEVLPVAPARAATPVPAVGGGRPDPGAAASLERTDVLPPRAQADPGVPRDVSIEELIDLEQQAEFFVVLGQDEAAVDLLVEHLRTTGGGSPLPYLKLLEIHHRLGDRAAYERTRSRFNHRFNAFAPEWGADLHGGRSLEDYPGVVPRLQQVWSRPLDAMAELEALLFRKSLGELFELPAYREVLFLYSLARDLMDHEATDTSSVDLLLPLSDGGEFGSTAPAPFTGLQGATSTGPAPDFDSRPTAPVDFDISVAERGSIFGSLDEAPAPRRLR